MKDNSKIGNITVVDQVCERLKKSILVDECEANEKLPSEGKLANRQEAKRKLDWIENFA